MNISDLRPNEGAKKSRRRVGRGLGAGQGKTAGRGIKGQHSRSGQGGHLYHQGGNLPFYRRLPFMRGEGFTPPNQVHYNELNVEQLNRFEAGMEVTPEVLLQADMLGQSKNPVVILGDGELTVALKVKVHRVSKGARAKIEAAGGSVELIA